MCPSKRSLRSSPYFGHCLAHPTIAKKVRCPACAIASRRLAATLFGALILRPHEVRDGDAVRQSSGRDNPIRPVESRVGRYR